MNTFVSKPEQERPNALQSSIGPTTSWSFKTDVGVAMYNSVIDWSRYPIGVELKILAQRFLLQRWKPAAAIGESIIPQHEFRYADALLRALALVERDYPNRMLKDLTKSDWIKVIIAALFHRFDGCSPIRQLITLKEPLAVKAFERTVVALKCFYRFYHEGRLGDGPEFNIKRKDVFNVLRAELESHGVDFDDWLRGGSYGSIPFAIAHLLLSDALTVLRSPKTQKLLAYFETVREQKSFGLLKAFWTNKKTTYLHRYRMSGDKIWLDETREATDLTNRAKVELGLPLHEKLLAKQPTNTKFIFPWPTYKYLRSDYNTLMGALYIIFLSVMGKRGPSEVLTLRGIDITMPDEAVGRDAVMRPRIEKSCQGLRNAQGVTNFIDEAFKIILKLGYVDKTDTEHPLFTSLPRMTKVFAKPRVISVTVSSDWLHMYYEEFCIRMSTKVDFTVPDNHRSISSHQFRHSWAEFALRKFDGNVEEMIRQHFLHSYNHWWTKRYTGDKLDADARIRANRDYLRELVPRILQDSKTKPDYVGAMSLYIKKTLGEQITVLSPEEVEDRIREFGEEILQLTAHEYGWCLLHKSFRHAAQCNDSNANPNPQATSSDKCNGCANFVSSRASHLAKQTQLAIAHMDFLEQNTWKLESLKQTSRSAVSQSIQLFPELVQVLNLS